MEMKKVGKIAKYAAFALAGCAVVIVAAESASERGRNDAPVLTAANSVKSDMSSLLSPDKPASSSAPTNSSSLPVQVSVPQSSSSVTVSTIASDPIREQSASLDNEPETQSSEQTNDSSAVQSIPEQTASEIPRSSVTQTVSNEASGNDVIEYDPPVSMIIDVDRPSSSSSSKKPSASSSSSSKKPASSSTSVSSSPVESPVMSSSEPPAQSSEVPEPSVPIIPEILIVNINTASVEELVQLDGIGEDKARAIIDFRERFGYYVEIYDILNVDGIGDSTFERIRDFITV